MKENVCAYKIIWKINAVLSVFFQWLESRNVLQPILASSRGGRGVRKYRQGAWAERSSCCRLLFSFTWRNARGTWEDAGRVVAALQVFPAMLRASRRRTVFSLDLSLVVLFVGSNLGDLSTESLSQGELRGLKARCRGGDESYLKCESTDTPPFLSGSEFLILVEAGSWHS